LRVEGFAEVSTPGSLGHLERANFDLWGGSVGAGEKGKREGERDQLHGGLVGRVKRSKCEGRGFSKSKSDFV
jgi:hypothetical protein